MRLLVRLSRQGKTTKVKTKTLRMMLKRTKLKDRVGVVDALTQLSDQGDAARRLACAHYGPFGKSGCESPMGGD
jgi:hypothetical protein